MQMPEMDGITLGSEIRKLPQGQSLPLLLYTSLGRRVSDSSSVDLAAAAGFTATLSKPIKTSQLFDALATIFGLQPAYLRRSTFYESAAGSRDGKALSPAHPAGRG